MTTIEVCEELRARGKMAYLGVMSKQRFSNTLIRIEFGIAKPSTVQTFFFKFLFSGDGDFWFDINATE